MSGGRPINTSLYPFLDENDNCILSEERISSNAIKPTELKDLLNENDYGITFKVDYLSFGNNKLDYEEDESRIADFFFCYDDRMDNREEEYPLIESYFLNDDYRYSYPGTRYFLQKVIFNEINAAYSFLTSTEMNYLSSQFPLQTGIVMLDGVQLLMDTEEETNENLNKVLQGIIKDFLKHKVIMNNIVIFNADALTKDQITLIKTYTNRIILFSACDFCRIEHLQNLLKDVLHCQFNKLFNFRKGCNFFKHY